ncbi:MAG: glycosyltransferase family 39 protein, partial [candidate division Zixibacteria bacterium]|nr:glycosyltransferase family 39 protein [candidate division Zixibacteria bacterium]
MNKRLTHNTWPLVIFLAAFLLRLIYLLQYRSNPSFYLPMVDELWHLEWAKDIIGGNFWGSEAYFRGPLYPYVLAAFLKITGDSLFWVRLLQAVIGSLSAVMVYLIGRRLFVPAVGIIAALAYAAYGTIIFYETMLLIPVLFIFLNLVAVYLLLRYQGSISSKHWLLAGLVVGLSAIARPNILILAPIFLVWIYLSFHAVDTRRKISLAAVFLVGTLIPVLSVTARNYMVTGEPILISSQGGVNLYIGNNPETEGLTMLMPELDLNESLPWTEFAEATRIAAERESGHSLTAAGESSFWTKKALVFIVSNPGKFIGITFKKLVYFLIGFENSDQTDIYFSRTYSSLLSLLIWKSPIYFPFGLIVPLALIGMMLSWPRRRELALLYVFIIGYIPTVILFLVTARHRLAVIPFLLLFAAFGGIALKDFAVKREWRKFTGYLALFLIALILGNRTYFDIGFENTAQIHFNLGLTYERQGDLGRAESEYLES